jgi:GNAT superfamily N-acetyltransferase
MDINIRFASPNDATDLANLRFALRSQPESNTETETVFLQRCTSWMAEALQQTSWRCWVAEHDGSLIGALWLQLIEKIPNPTSEPENYAYITNFFVSESVRGRGLGSRMLNQALSWCRDQEVEMIVLWPSDRSRSLYQRHGFTIREELLGLLISEIRTVTR